MRGEPLGIVQLPPKQRTVIELRIVHELPFAAIAKIANCSEDSAKANFRDAARGSESSAAIMPARG